MIDSTSASISALTAFQTKLDTTSNNIANVLTNGYKKDRVILQEGESGGVKAIVDHVDTQNMPGEAVASNKNLENELPNVDLAEEMTNLMITQKAYNANLKGLKVHDEMLGAILDFLA